MSLFREVSFLNYDDWLIRSLVLVVLTISVISDIVTLMGVSLSELIDTELNTGHLWVSRCNGVSKWVTEWVGEWMSG